MMLLTILRFSYPAMADVSNEAPMRDSDESKQGFKSVLYVNTNGNILLWRSNIGSDKIFVTIATIMSNKCAERRTNMAPRRTKCMLGVASRWDHEKGQPSKIASLSSFPTAVTLKEQ